MQLPSPGAPTPISRPRRSRPSSRRRWRRLSASARRLSGRRRRRARRRGVSLASRWSRPRQSSKSCSASATRSSARRRRWRTCSTASASASSLRLTRRSGELRAPPKVFHPSTRIRRSRRPRPPRPPAQEMPRMRRPGPRRQYTWTFRLCLCRRRSTSSAETATSCWTRMSRPWPSSGTTWSRTRQSSSTATFARPTPKFTSASSARRGVNSSSERWAGCARRTA
mmetsp:Transcript_24476/g.66497  ORF Transcript_24476/g.66497 Transcript_24476/m.66497 type:complete len:225 (-) Transcript_24476:988-1662(-)